MSEVARSLKKNMDVAGGQEFPAAGLQPAVARVGLALRTSPVATRVEGDGAMPAGGALVDVPTQRGCPAADDGGQDLQVQPGEPLPAVHKERRARGADQIGRASCRER